LPSVFVFQLSCLVWWRSVLSFSLAALPYDFPVGSRCLAKFPAGIFIPLTLGGSSARRPRRDLCFRVKRFGAGIACQGDIFLYRFTRSTRFPSQLARSPFRSWICGSSDQRLFWSAFPDPVCRVQFSFALRSRAGYYNWPRFAAHFSSWFWSRNRRAIFFFLLSRSAVKVSPKIFWFCV
jgi:hypothetical protein